MGFTKLVDGTVKDVPIAFQQMASLQAPLKMNLQIMLKQPQLEKALRWKAAGNIL